MKKLFGALVKLFSLLAVLGALLYAAVLYWDKIMAVVAKLRGMLPGPACPPPLWTTPRRRTTPTGRCNRIGGRYGHIILLCDHSGPFSCPAGLYLPKTDVI